MEHLHLDQSSTSSPRSTSVERSPSRRRWRQRVGSVRMVPPDSATATDRETRGHSPKTASRPRASERRSRPCHRRDIMSAMVATALLLCFPFTAMASLGGRHPVAFQSFARRSVRPSVSMRTKAPPPRPSALDTAPTARSLEAPRRRSEPRESRFGVRRRVRRVLSKARKRTGVGASSPIANESRRGEEYYFESSLDLVPDTAAVGKLGLVAQERSGDGANISTDPPVQCCNGTSARVERYEHPATLTESEVEVPGAAVKIGEAIEASVKNGASDGANISADPSVQGCDGTSARLEEYEDPANLTELEAEVPRAAMKIGEVIAKGRPQPVPAELPCPKKSADSCEPLPFQLPTLDREQSGRLAAGERVQFQEDMGRAGSGYVVWDIQAPAAVVWDCLLDFPSYPRMMTTVREVDLEDGVACRPGTPSMTRARFSLSKFRLPVAAVHEYQPHPRGDHMTFTLDPSCNNPILKHAEGIWYAESEPDGKAGVTRVWLLCEVRVSRLVPQCIVDYATARAMPRATTWLKPVIEGAARSGERAGSSRATNGAPVPR